MDLQEAIQLQVQSKAVLCMQHPALALTLQSSCNIR